MKRIPYLREPVDLVVECYSSVPEAKKIEQYHDELREVLNFRGDQRIVSLSHHLAHVYSTFFVSPYKEAAVLVVDFRAAAPKTSPNRGRENPHASRTRSKSARSITVRIERFNASANSFGTMTESGPSGLALSTIT